MALFLLYLPFHSIPQERNLWAKTRFLRELAMLASKEAERLSSLVSSSCELLRIEQWYLGNLSAGVWGPEELERQCVH